MPVPVRSLARQRDNAPLVELSTPAAGLGAQPRDYHVDGPVGVYQKVSAEGRVDRVIIYITLRRGGRALHALDVTDPTEPKFLWSLSPGKTGMAALGQTWSEPKAARVRGYSNPVLIFGGGYDAAAEDGGATPTMGNAVFVVDALEGRLLRAFGAADGLPWARTPAAGRSPVWPTCGVVPPRAASSSSPLTSSSRASLWP